MKYFDRYSGKEITEKIYANRFLHWSYNTKSGRLLTDCFLRYKIASVLYSLYNKSSFSKSKIRSFIHKMNIDISDMAGKPESFNSFNDFFIRKIDFQKRKINTDKNICISPADGRVLVYPHIQKDTEIKIKRSIFQLQHVVQDDNLAGFYHNGSMAIIRLYLTDYHRFYFPDSGSPGNKRIIKGYYYSVTPYSQKEIIPFYTKNIRHITPFNSDNFAKILIIEIGSFTVGSIRQTFTPGKNVNKGQEKGYFEIGGSTVILLFQPDVIGFDTDLIMNSKTELETFVKCGDSLGHAAF